MPHEGSSSTPGRSWKDTLDDVSLLTQPAERGRYLLSSLSFTRKHQIRFINKHFSENDSKPMVQRGGQSVHNPGLQPCRWPGDGSLHRPWNPRQSKRSRCNKRSPRLSHLCEIVVRPLRATWDFLLIGGGKREIAWRPDSPFRWTNLVQPLVGASLGPDRRPPIWRLRHGWALAEAVRVMLNIGSQRDYHVFSADLRGDWCSLGFFFFF